MRDEISSEENCHTESKASSSSTSDQPIFPSDAFSYSSNPDILPYDAWVMAGGRLFRAHAHILSAHSPYLRASISTLGEARLLLPHIPSGGFSAVLTYMYTGRLSLTQAPVYEILVTGHLLQMPSVMALCQALLTASAPALQPSLTTTPLLPVLTSDTRGSTFAGGGILPPALSAWRNLARLVPTAGLTPMVQPTLIKPTPTRPTLVPQSSSPECESFAHPSTNVARFVFCPNLTKGANISLQADEGENSSTSTSIVLDIAACDGPVFFERVINKAFRKSESETGDASDDTDDSEINVVDPAGTEAPYLKSFLTTPPQTLKPQQTPIPYLGSGSRTYHCVYCNNTFKSHYCYQKHMRRHINPITVEEDRGRETLDDLLHPNVSCQENNNVTITNEKSDSVVDEGPSTSRDEGPSTARTGSVGTLNVYESDQTNGSSSPTTNVSTENISSSGGKLRVLDLNVQYFPCKTCGSKFPSYYFVHKHRRMCHMDEDDDLIDGNVIQTSSSCDTPSLQERNNIEERKNN